jgi:hypothetical protein
MKRRKKGRHFKTWANQRQETLRQRTFELEPEDFASYVRQAEKEVLPIIKDMQLGPGAAQLVLALHAQMLVTGDPRLTPESMMAAGTSVLALWQAGYYTPTPEYPFTLEETLRDVEVGPQAKADYAEAFQPFGSTGRDVPLGLGTVHGGIVRHPETELWQIWMIVDGPCAFIAAYHDPVKAQRNLETIINISRKGGNEAESAALYKRVQSQADGEPQQLPYDMMLYLVEHLDRYSIKL